MSTKATTVRIIKNRGPAPIGSGFLYVDWRVFGLNQYGRCRHVRLCCVGCGKQQRVRRLEGARESEKQEAVVRVDPKK